MMRLKLREIGDYILNHRGGVKNFLFCEKLHGIVFTGSKWYIKGRLNRTSKNIPIDSFWKDSLNFFIGR